MSQYEPVLCGRASRAVADELQDAQLDLRGGLSLLSGNADVRFYPYALAADLATRLQRLLFEQTDWQSERLTLFGRSVEAPRRIAWHGDADARYRYAGTDHRPLPWTETLRACRDLCDRDVGSVTNSVLLNLYRDGSDGMGWHADDEKELGPRPTIVSLSLGATRRFLLRDRAKTRASLRVDLGHGSVLVMRGETQRLWRHAVPKSRRPLAPRINLTFRQVRGGRPS